MVSTEKSDGTVFDDKKKRLQRTYLFGGMICLFFLALSLAFVLWMVQTNEQRNKKFLFDAAAQTGTSLVKQIQGDLQTLTGIAICLGESEVDTDESVGSILREINDSNAFIRMGYTDLNGVADLVDLDGTIHRGEDLSGLAVVQDALAGKAGISNTFADPITGSNVNYYAVPMKHDGKVIGALCAVHDASIFCGIIGGSVFDGAGYSNIVNGAGDYIMRSCHPDARIGAKNIYELNFLEIDVREDLLADFEKGTTGFFTYCFQGEVRWVAYKPLGINDWSIVTTVPRNEINNIYTLTAIGVSVLIALSLGIFIFFVYRIETANRRSNRELEQLAYTDSLTGCRSYPKFLNDAKALLDAPSQQRRALVYCDLKRFKYLNDLMGYDAGDDILRGWVRLMEERVQEGEAFGRVSADNFAFLQCYTNESEFEERFLQLMQSLAQLELLKAHHYRLEASAGVYRIGRDERLSVNEMLNRANIAQKSVKSRPGNCLACYTDSMREHVLRETRMEANIESGFHMGEFQIYPQLQIDIQHGDKISGMEALSRWNSAKSGLIPPNEFIPLFEKNGWIIQLDRTVFENICKKARQYLDAGRTPLVMASNVSRLGMYQSDFLDFYTNMKKQYDIPDGILELEFTESIIWDNYELFRQNVVELQANGFLCAIDDFGSGYSSLNVLKNLPMDILKLDMLFFKEDSDVARARAVIANIVAMAKELNMKTVAEGVEQMEQVEFLREVGCDVVQGYVFSRPMPMAEFDKLEWL